MVTQVDKVKFEAISGIAFLAKCTIHWGSHGSGPAPVSLAVGQSHTWDLESLGVPETYRFWAVVEAEGGVTKGTDKHEFAFSKGSGVTAIYKITGSTLDPKIESSIEED